METRREVAGQLIPPSKDVLAMLYMDYLRNAKDQGLKFFQYLNVIGYGDPAKDIAGMDDILTWWKVDSKLELIRVPYHRILGDLRLIILLVDFPDKPALLPKEHYEDIFFSRNTFLSGSVRDYYHEVSLGKVDIIGTVHGWFRMPLPYSYYTNQESGMRGSSYPRNAQRMAEDAVKAALSNGVKFDSGLDKLGDGTVTALCVVHAGRGAEVLHPRIAKNEIWSHKWLLREPIEVGPSLFASIYLTVPEDCKVGVCAHELGHLAFQWQDFYDPNYNEDGKYWDGTGVWDLMASGSYNGDGARPAHPAGLHKAQHGWVEVQTIRPTGDPVRLTLPPYSATSGTIVRIESPSFKSRQYLLLENRRRQGFDSDLPGEGLLLWLVDESGEMESSVAPGLYLIQADGQHHLENPNDWNTGDAGDPFPGSKKKIKISDVGDPCTSFPGSDRSGIVLSEISEDPEGNVNLTVVSSL